MRAGPPRLIEALVSLLLPPASREHVLGDLCERYASTRQYIADAALTVPLVIASRIRRTTDAVVLFMEAGILYSSFYIAARFLDAPFLTQQEALLRLAIPSVIALAALVLIDAYADPRKRSPLRPILGAVLALGLAFLAQALPQPVMIAGGGASLLLISTLRLLFPPITDRPQGVNFPARWQKQTIEPTAAKAIWAIAIVVSLLFVFQLLRRG